MSVFKIGINEEGNQANHQRQHQGILCPVKIAPTNTYVVSGEDIEDFRLKESIPYGLLAQVSVLRRRQEIEEVGVCTSLRY